MIHYIFSFGWLLLIPLVWLVYSRVQLKMRLEMHLGLLQRESEEKSYYQDEAARLQEEVTRLRIGMAEAELLLSERGKVNEEQRLADEKRLKEAFKMLSLEAMQGIHAKTESELAKKEESLSKMMQPVKETLTKLDEGMRLIEKERKGEQESLKQYLVGVVEAEKALRVETSNLVKALRKPQVRGMWGEMQLRRVLEISGMVQHCDFYEQQSKESDEGRIRPDFLIKLPGDRQVIIDSKVPLEAFLEANETEDVLVHESKMQDHARALRQYIVQLGRKSYWQSFQPSPEFVILFLPAEIFFSAALQYDPTLIELGAELGVILATPTTLIGLMRAIAHGWKQDTLSKHAQQICDLGEELHKRLSDMNKHWMQLGKSLSTAVDGYNKAMSSLERRVLVSARKFKEFGAASAEITLDPIEFIEKIPSNCLADLVSGELEV